MTSNEPSWNGRIIGDRYEIAELIGRGGMSSVYRAVDPNLKRNVAIKIIHPHLTDNEEFIQRFEQEAAAIAQLRHHNIVQVHDFNNENGVYYMVMEYIAGETLAQKINALKNAQMQMPVAEVIKILAKVCDAVNYAHERRMIHRDLKPGNVMINLHNDPILMDFGIAKIIGGQSHTATGAAMGTAPYMSPEQVRGDKTDHRTDIYSLGIMLYEMLSGSPPFHGDSTFQIMLCHINEPVPDIRQFDLNTPLSLVTILEKALAKESEARFQSAKEMGTALSAAGLQLHGSVTDTLAARYLDRLAILWQQATDNFDNHRFEACIDKLDELKQVDPNFQRLKIDELRQSAIDRLYERAVLRYQTGSYQESQTILNALALRAPDEPDIEQLARKIQHGLDNQQLLTKLESFYEEAAVFLDSRGFDQALGRWRLIERQRGELPFADPLNIENRAKEGICNNTYNQAVVALSNSKPDETLRLWDEIIALMPEYKDVQQIVAKANLQMSDGKQERNQRRLGIILGLFILLGIGFFGIRALMGNDDPTPQPTSTAAVAVAALTNTATVTAGVPTNTAVFTPTPTPIPSATPEAEHTATAQPSITPSPQLSSTPIPAAVEIEEITAVATDNATLFTEPSSDAGFVTYIGLDEVVTVLGRTSNESWLLIQTADGEKGFAAASRFQLSITAVADLPVVTPEAYPGNPTPVTGSNSGPLSIETYYFDESGRCDNGNWYRDVFVIGRGGNGAYAYYANDVLQAAGQTEGMKFEVQGAGSNITIKVRVDSGDGQSLSTDLFIPKPDSCN